MNRELMNAHPKATAAAKAYYMEKLLDNIKNSESLPEDFKEFARQRGVDDENILVMMDASPRALFDIMDINQLYIEIGVVDGEGGFRWRINGGDWSSSFRTRIEAEKEAITVAYKLLDDALTETVM